MCTAKDVDSVVAKFSEKKTFKKSHKGLKQKTLLQNGGNRLIE